MPASFSLAASLGPAASLIAKSPFSRQHGAAAAACHHSPNLYPFSPTTAAEAGTKAKKKAFKRRFWTCRRTKDLDQVQDEVRQLEEGSRALTSYLDEDAAGGGAFMCVTCARSFTSEVVLAGHYRTKPHKRMLKLVAAPQYTQKEADAGAGRSS